MMLARIQLNGDPVRDHLHIRLEGGCQGSVEENRHFPVHIGIISAIDGIGSRIEGPVALADPKGSWSRSAHPYPGSRR